MAFSVAAVANGTLNQDMTPGQATNGQAVPANVSTQTNFNNVPVVVADGCALPNPNVYFVNDTTTAPQAYFEANLFNPGPSAPLTLGASQSFGTNQAFGLPIDFLTQVGTTVDGTLSPISRLAAFQTILNERPLIASEIWLQSATQTLTQGQLRIVSFDYNISPSFRPVPLAFCDACIFNNGVFTQVYRGAFSLTPNTGISLLIPTMGDGASLRFKLVIGGQTQFGYVDANPGVAVVNV